MLFSNADLQHVPAEIAIQTRVRQAEEGIGDFVIGDAASSRRTRCPQPGSIERDWQPYPVAVHRDPCCRFAIRIPHLVRSELLRRLDLTSTGYEIETEMLIKLVRAGARLERVLVQRLPVQGARSKIGRSRRGQNLHVGLWSTLPVR